MTKRLINVHAKSFSAAYSSDRWVRFVLDECGIDAVGSIVFIYPSFAMGNSCGSSLRRRKQMFERTPEAITFYGSRRWKKCRKNYLSIHPICERCEKQGIISKADHVHHKIRLEVQSYADPMISLNYDNLEALCFACHQAEHHKAKDCRDELFFDAAGNLRKG